MTCFCVAASAPDLLRAYQAARDAGDLLTAALRTRWPGARVERRSEVVVEAVVSDVKIAVENR